MSCFCLRWIHFFLIWSSVLVMWVKIDFLSRFWIRFIHDEYFGYSGYHSRYKFYFWSLRSFNRFHRFTLHEFNQLKNCVYVFFLVFSILNISLSLLKNPSTFFIHTSIDIIMNRFLFLLNFILYQLSLSLSHTHYSLSLYLSLFYLSHYSSTCAIIILLYCFSFFFDISF